MHVPTLICLFNSAVQEQGQAGTQTFEKGMLSMSMHFKTIRTLRPELEVYSVSCEQLRDWVPSTWMRHAAKRDLTRYMNCMHVLYSTINGESKWHLWWNQRIKEKERKLLRDVTRSNGSDALEYP